MVLHPVHEDHIDHVFMVITCDNNLTKFIVLKKQSPIHC
jgi:hypothetical protein